ncbi:MULTISPECIES: MarR family winged helix-turn-helix transcriptional regulator [unclassified Sporosarcina]|uniref:MarR family winged helix-turn-helix transcriptional regulator n=1 Tax=unclassified Sporosarcina TaxID=2647733 RepID=UPI0020405F31|nr:MULTISPECIES: MarR family transcriptional regulator [unclassified Sporosarcina]GKV67356.1 MarR family transcriptional regulator [Sporosarcina sp. NCCP-2331]GLB57712.1 MarR family transcriptional regulator [Sporosarcina sp. NCCP-2378]
MRLNHQEMFKELTVVFSEYYLNYLLYNKNAQKFNAYNLTAQQDTILFFLKDNPHITANEIAKKFMISKSAVSQVLSKLEALNFIKRESNPNNHRELFIELAEEGVTYQTLSEEADEEFMTKHFADIDLEQLRNVLQTMKKVNASISSSNK